MNLIYKRATIDDLEFLVKTRIEVLRAANQLENTVGMEEVERQSREYYIKALKTNMHTAYLIFDDDFFVGTGGISYYDVMPTYHNPTGQKAYIMNMYVRPDYRRMGIATKTLDLLVKDAKDRGINTISLEATKMGKSLYKSYGFTKMENEMELLN
ncbi:MAG: GNAT family N-acetyltransferase [Lachnospiraceae bacterium]|nr:GNAT family N-acetyltransferase [Lachnospiraceae bacterium]